jgi:Arc/MetJ-type ribon-helix-helix transcriptional regulator
LRLGVRGANRLERYLVGKGRGSRLVVASPFILLYGECMARMISTTVRLNEEDVRALKRARAAGHSTSELIRKGLRVVASRYYTGRRPPSTLLFESTDTKLGDESELFRNLED